MTHKLRDPGPPIGSGRRAESIELAEETAIIRREDTRRALLAKAGLVAGGVGIATLARPGSAEASTVSGQELEWNNVKDDQFAGGATGDGHTDDAPAIQAALNASGGPKLTYLPPGTYLCGSTLRLGSNAHLLGVPGQSIIKAGAPPDLDPGPITPKARR